jgi:predicted N-acetyltransferase YhbS
MLAVEKEHRKLGIGSELVVKVIEKMRDEGAHEVRQSLID